MQLPPLSVVEAWPAADPNASSRGQANLIVNLVLFPLALLFLILRIYTRLAISRSFGLDDVLILAAMIPTIAFFVLALMVDLHWNLFRHAWDIPLPEASVQLKMNLAVNCIFSLAFSMTKLSILQLVRRILERSTSKAGILILVTMGIVVAECVSFMLTVIFQCSPVSAYWTVSLGPQDCLNEQTHLLVAGTFNTITDLLVVLIPIYLVWSLHLPIRQNAIVSSSFALGLIVVIAGVFRTILFYQEGASDDKSWAAYMVWLPSEIELYLGVLCASIPPIQPLVVRLFPRVIGNGYRPSTKSSPMLTPPMPTPERRCSPIQTRFSEAASHIHKQFTRASTLSISTITVEDEVLISYEKRLEKRARRPQNNVSDSVVDLESGLVKPKKARRWGEGDRSIRSQQLERLNSALPPLPPPPPPSRSIMTPQSPKSSQKSVRIDLENSSFRTITADRHWSTVARKESNQKVSIQARAHSSKKMRGVRGKARESDGSSATSDSHIAGFDEAIKAFPIAYYQQNSSSIKHSPGIIPTFDINSHRHVAFYQSEVKDPGVVSRDIDNQYPPSHPVDSLREQRWPQRWGPPSSFGHKCSVDKSSDSGSILSGSWSHLNGIIGNVVQRDSPDPARRIADPPSLMFPPAMRGMAGSIHSLNSDASMTTGNPSTGNPQPLGNWKQPSSPMIDSPTFNNLTGLRPSPRSTFKKGAS